MLISKQQITPTQIKLTIKADQSALTDIKSVVLKRLSRNVKISGFRQGKAPASLVEKQLDPSLLQSEFLDEAINSLYRQALTQEKVRPIDQPKITVSKFVPFSLLEFMADMAVIGDINLTDYSKIKLAKKVTKVSTKEIDEVINDLKQRAADRVDVKRAAVSGDQVMINFKGIDAKTKLPINGAEGSDYPLILGSNSFIPGFETNLVGVKAGQSKTFTIVFPKDYTVSTLRNRRVIFDVTVTKVQKISQLIVDDKFAAKVSPFKSLTELRADIKKQLMTQKQAQSDRLFENELLEAISNQSEVVIPEPLIAEDALRLRDQERQNVNYRGQTWPEYLQELGQTDDDYLASLRQQAEKRVKVGLILTEIADREKIFVTPEELAVRIQLLKGQYQDKEMQAELEKAENQQSILSRMLSEKTIARLSQLSAV